MSKYFLTIFFSLLISFLFAPAANAHPGNTDSSGGHTCRTNCPRWGLDYGEYHYHGGSRPAPYIPPIVKATPTSKPVPSPIPSPKPTATPVLQPSPFLTPDPSKEDSDNTYWYLGGLAALVGGGYWLYKKYS